MARRGNDKDAPAKGNSEAVEMATYKAPEDPDWAAGLKQLYDSVVNEDIPDIFKDLLSSLDEQEGK